MRKLVVALSAVVAVAGACGDPSPAVEAKVVVPRVPAPVEQELCAVGRGRVIYERFPFGINSLSALSKAILIGEVVIIGEPRWNSKDGRKWCPPNDQRAPIKYRDVTVKVTDVVAASPELNVAVGNEIVVMSFCDEAFPEAPPDPAADPESCGETNDGTWTKGASNLLALSISDSFPTESGTTSVVQLTGSNGGHWEIDKASGTARSSVQGRTVPLSDLLQRTREERKHGYDPGRDEGTRVNPLGA